MSSQEPGNPLPPGRQDAPAPLPAAGRPEPEQGAGEHASGPAPRLDATAALIASVDQLSSELQALQRRTRSTERTVILIFGAIVYLTWVVNKGRGQNVRANTSPVE